MAAEEDWELRATRVAVALDIAADELKKLITEFRKRRGDAEPKEDDPDGRQS